MTNLKGFNETLPGEEWRFVKGSKDYMISSKGRVLSFKLKMPKLLSIGTTKKGYKDVSLQLPGHPKRPFVHRLVAESFLGEISGLEIDHIDNNKSNNCVENLDIVTRAENMRRAAKDKLIVNQHGEDNVLSKLNRYQVKRIRLLVDMKNLTRKEVGKMFGISGAHVSRIHGRKAWRHI